MPITPEELYLQLGALMAEMPDLTNGPVTLDMHRWMGRACALIEQSGELTYSLTDACQTLASFESSRPSKVQLIVATVCHALAKAELKAPARVQGAFIAAGNTLDAYAAVGRVLGMAKANVLLVDPYADVKTVTEYAVLAPDTVAVRILADRADHKSTLKPAAEKWAQQFGSTRAPLEVRLAPPKALHDRLLVVDQAVPWMLGQSLKDLVTRSPTTIARVDGDAGARKIAYYMATWQAATPL
jgi:hypothetical protein